MRMYVLALLAGLHVADADIIDRIAVVVGERVITESEIVRQIRITAFINGEKAVVDPERKRAAADRLVEQALLRRELESSRLEPSAGAAKDLQEQIVKRYASTAAYQQALKDYSITEDEVRQATAWQASILEFVAARFRPAVQISEAELRDYYQQEVVPKAGGQKPDFEDVRVQIESILTDQRVDNALDRWLGGARTQTRIRFRNEVFQ
ncbi:MAG TPA: hypothetical protein VEQ63_05855 [Bryobacteraceae bacterium]|nr:hypothetical protein [Bryobacteraceae bacterium]